MPTEWPVGKKTETGDVCGEFDKCRPLAGKLIGRITIVVIQRDDQAVFEAWTQEVEDGDGRRMKIAIDLGKTDVVWPGIIEGFAQRGVVKAFDHRIGILRQAVFVQLGGKVRRR